MDHDLVEGGEVARGPGRPAGIVRQVLACALILGLGTSGVLISALPLPRVDLGSRMCLGGRDIPAAMWLLVVGMAVASLAVAAGLGRWSVPWALRGRIGVGVGLVAVLGMAATTWSALWIATLPYDCGAPIPVLDPLFALLPAALATSLVSVSVERSVIRALTVGLLVVGPIVLELSLGWGLYGGAEAARTSLIVSAVSALLGLTPARASGRRSKLSLNNTFPEPGQARPEGERRRATSLIKDEGRQRRGAS